MDAIKVLDHGFVRLVESWGHGDAGEGKVSVWTSEGTPSAPHREDDDMECGIIEAARQSTQAAFRGWDDVPCPSLTCSHGLDTSILNWNIPPHAKCEKCDGKGFLPGDARLLHYLFNNKPPHATPFEFAGCVIEVRAPIFVFREWHRHRTQSYNEMSARYAPLPDLNYVPTVERCLLNSTKNKQAGRVKGADDLLDEDASVFQLELMNMYDSQEKFYQKWLQRGISKELARIDLPVGRYSQMRAQTNLRNWLAFMTLRNDPGAQWEIQEFARAVGTILADQFPRTWALYVEEKKV